MPASHALDSPFLRQLWAEQKRLIPKRNVLGPHLTLHQLQHSVLSLVLPAGHPPPQTPRVPTSSWLPALVLPAGHPPPLEPPEFPHLPGSLCNAFPSVLCPCQPLSLELRVWGHSGITMVSAGESKICLCRARPNYSVPRPRWRQASVMLSV